MEAAATDLEHFRGFKGLANGRLERPKNRGLCAGKRQAAALEQQRLTATKLGGSCREAPWHGRPNNRGLCRQTAGSNAGTAKAHSRAWWKPPRRI